MAAAASKLAHVPPAAILPEVLTGRLGELQSWVSERAEQVAGIISGKIAEISSLNEVHALAASKALQSQARARRLNDSLSAILAMGEDRASELMPIVTALQFQDATRQELESLAKAMADYERLMQSGLPVEDDPALISGGMARVARDVLRGVVDRLEGACSAVTEQVGRITTLSEVQQRSLQRSFEGMYDEGESSDLKDTLNDTATLMMEAAARGDMEEVERLAASSGYQDARKATKSLHDAMQQVLEADTALGRILRPVTQALQLLQATGAEFEQLAGDFSAALPRLVPRQSGGVPGSAQRGFFEAIASHFNNTESRRIVLLSGIGEEPAKDHPLLGKIADDDVITFF